MANTKKTSTKKPCKNKKTAKKENIKKVKVEETTTRKINKKITTIVAFLFAVLFIFSSYAWFSTNLNVNIRTFTMSVNRDTDLQISFDGINYDYTIEVTKDLLVNTLQDTYPNHNSQYAANGFIPVSSPGIRNANSPLFDMYETSGVLYKKRKAEDGFLYTEKAKEDERRTYNSYLAFYIFIKNKTGSPNPDNLYFQTSTSIVAADEDIDDEMLGLVNSFRLGIVKIGWLPHETPVNQIQNMTCNNDCRSIIYEPNNKEHTAMSIERATKYGITLRDGFKFPTYALSEAGGPYYVKESVSGSPNMNLNAPYLTYQETITEENFSEPLFPLENGVTKARIYVWIEGQDIDSLETNSKGADVNITIDFVKDTAGYEDYEM